MITAKVIGAGGYGGVGIVELLLRHPEVELTTLVAKADVGMPISDLYPHLKGFCDLPILSADDEAAKAPADVVFFATPDRVAMTQARAELDAGAKVIDYSGDFRFDSKKKYADYATRLGKEPTHADADLLKETAYGLPELKHGNVSADSRLIGNPGCFAVSCLLGLAPAIRYDLITLDSIICDCKTGVSGAGKKPSPAFHYPARYEQMNAYRLAGHQHVCEVEQELEAISHKATPITFTAQVVPINRGILSTLYGRLAKNVKPKAVKEAYEVYYAEQPFIRLHDKNGGIGTMQVRGSNFCDLIVDVDERTDRLRVISHIDNLVKGQAGNALQNMNILFGFPEKMGLDHPGQYP